MRASRLLSSWSRASGPRRLALLAGAGAVAAAAVVGAAGREEEGVRVPGAASWLLVGHPLSWGSCNHVQEPSL